MTHSLDIMVFAKTSNIQGETMSHYKHLTPYQREKIFLLHSQNKTLTYIAETIHRDKSTISQEIARNCHDGIYSPGIAQNIVQLADPNSSSLILKYSNMLKRSF